jgi:RNA polymerase sigma-70 factor, ECF subfamily
LDQKSQSAPPFPAVDEFETQPTVARPGVPGFAELFRDHAQFLWRTLVNLGVPRHDAPDLCQEVMITVHRRLPDFDGRSLRGWLYGICVRMASDYRRSARVRREIPHAAPPDTSLEPDQAEQVERSRTLAVALEALERLGEEKRAAFVLYEIEGLTLGEVAEAVDAPLQTVYSRVKAARDSLRRDVEVAMAARGGVREAG